MVLTLGEEQVALLSKAKDYLKHCEKRKIDVSVYADCYLNSWGSVPGYGKLLLLNGRSIFSKKVWLPYLNNFLSSFHVPYQKIASAKQSLSHSNIVLTWSMKSDFDSEGKYTDRYFKSRACDNLATKWILISTDGYKPESIESNVVILYRYPILFRSIIKNFLSWLVGVIKNPFPFDKIKLIPSASEILTNNITTLLESEITNSTKHFIIPYECQPFQNGTFKFVENRHPAILTIGYIHAAITPFPTDFLHRSGAPKLVWVNGSGQKEILVQHLSWKSDSILAIPSLRYRKGDRSYFGGKIFLPYEITDSKKLLSILSSYIQSNANESFDVRNHPARSESSSHKWLINQINLIHKGRPKQSLIFNKSIFIGVTSAILEALEIGLEVIHISLNPLFEVHTKEIWNDIESVQISKWIYSYKLNTKGTYINFGPENASFESVVTMNCKLD